MDPKERVIKSNQDMHVYELYGKWMNREYDRSGYKGVKG